MPPTTWPYEIRNASPRRLVARRPALSVMASVRRGGGIVCFALAILGACASQDSVKAANLEARVICAGSSEGWDRVAFRRVDLGPLTRGGTIPILEGPPARRTVSTNAEWQQLWAEIGDTASLPRIVFGDSTLIVAASRVFGSGPSRLEIEDVVECRGTRELVATLRVRSSEQKFNYPDRTIRAVLVPTELVGRREVRFVELPPVVLAQAAFR